MLTSTQHLDQKALTDLHALIDACRHEDGHAIATYPDLLMHSRPRPASLLYYDENRLVGFAAAFFFEVGISEISLLVAPSHRRQGIAHQLFHTLLTQIQETRPVEDITVSTPHETYRTLFQNHDFQYQNSEYEMRLTHEQSHSLNSNCLKTPTFRGLSTASMDPADKLRNVDSDPKNQHPLTLHTDLSIRLATYDDIQTLCAIDGQCFASTNPYSVARFEMLLQRENQFIFIIVHQNNIIGKAHLAHSKEDHNALLSDIAIIPSMQGRGFGRTLIAHCIQYAHTLLCKTINLSVEANNQHALRLYQHLGFSIVNVMDYWSRPILISKKADTV